MTKGDIISRQAAIAEFSCCELTPDGGIDVNYVIDFLMNMPSAQPEVRTPMSLADCISRQAAIDEIDEWIKAFRENGHKESAADARLIQDGIIQLPSAQPDWNEMIVICDCCGHAIHVQRQ